MDDNRQTKKELTKRLVSLLDFRIEQLSNCVKAVCYEKLWDDIETLDAPIVQDIIKKKEQEIFADILFPTTYGNTRFISMDDVKKQMKTNLDARALYSQCALYGIGTPKEGTTVMEGLFEAANGGCSDAILYLGRQYELGISFLRKDLNQALNLYKYAYSLQNIDALHSLGYILYKAFDFKEIGISMMKKSSDIGSRSAKFHLGLLADKVKDIAIMEFEDIPKEVFSFDEAEALRSISLYAVDLTNRQEIKKAILETMSHIKPQTFSGVMNEFRKKYLRNREIECFPDIDFKGILLDMVNDGDIETGSVNSFGVLEDVLYIYRKSTEQMKTIILEGDDWDD